MTKIDLSKNAVAYFDKGVDEPGFYLLTGTPSTSEVVVSDGGKLAMTLTNVGEPDENGDVQQEYVYETDARGRYVMAEESEPVETITVTHESSMRPSQRVWPSPDGEGFVTEDPKGGTNG